MTLVARMEHPAKHLDKAIRDGKDTRDVRHNKVFGISLVLDGKMLVINVTRLFSRDTFLDH